MNRKPQQFNNLINDLNVSFNKQKQIQNFIDSHKPLLIEKYEVYQSKINK